MSATRDRSATPFSFGDDLRPSAAARRAAADLGRVAEEQRLGAIPPAILVLMGR